MEEYYKGLMNVFEVNGVRFPGLPSCTEYRVKKMIPSIEMRSEDVVLAGYPKCGNHWMKYVMAQISAQGDNDKANQQFIGEKVEFLEVVSPKLKSDGDQETDDEQFARWKATEGGRLFNTHLYWDMAPAGVRQGICKVILMVRNPKDLAISWFKFHSSFLPLGMYSKTFEDFLNIFLSEDGTAFGSYFKFYQSWWPHRDEIPMLIVHYEDMVLNPRNEIKRVVDFMDQPLSDEIIDRVTFNCSFDQMKNCGAMAVWNNLPEELLNRSKSPFMRKGISGDWRSVFTVAMNERFDKRYKQTMHSLDMPIKGI